MGALAPGPGGGAEAGRRGRDAVLVGEGGGDGLAERGVRQVGGEAGGERGVLVAGASDERAVGAEGGVGAHGGGGGAQGGGLGGGEGVEAQDGGGGGGGEGGEKWRMRSPPAPSSGDCGGGTLQYSASHPHAPRDFGMEEG